MNTTPEAMMNLVTALEESVWAHAKACYEHELGDTEWSTVVAAATDAFSDRETLRVAITELVEAKAVSPTTP